MNGYFGSNGQHALWLLEDCSCDNLAGKGLVDAKDLLDSVVVLTSIVRNDHHDHVRLHFRQLKEKGTVDDVVSLPFNYDGWTSYLVQILNVSSRPVVFHGDDFRYAERESHSGTNLLQTLEEFLRLGLKTGRVDDGPLAAVHGVEQLEISGSSRRIISLEKRDKYQNAMRVFHLNALPQSAFLGS